MTVRRLTAICRMPDTPAAAISRGGAKEDHGNANMTIGS